MLLVERGGESGKRHGFDGYPFQTGFRLSPSVRDFIKQAGSTGRLSERGWRELQRAVGDITMANGRIAVLGAMCECEERILGLIGSWSANSKKGGSGWIS